MNALYIGKLEALLIDNNIKNIAFTNKLSKLIEEIELEAEARGFEEGFQVRASQDIDGDEELHII